jgi:hypothetical protein
MEFLEHTNIFTGLSRLDLCITALLPHMQRPLLVAAPMVEVGVVSALAASNSSGTATILIAIGISSDVLRLFGWDAWHLDRVVDWVLRYGVGDGLVPRKLLRWWFAPELWVFALGAGSRAYFCDFCGEIKY